MATFYTGYEHHYDVDKVVINASTTLFLEQVNIFGRRQTTDA